MTIKSRGLARRRNVSKSRARKPSKAKQALLKRAQFFKAHAGGIVGEAMKGAVALARAEMLLEAAKEAGIAEVKWQQDDDVDTSWMDKKDMEDYRSGRVEYLGCVIEVNGEHCGSLWGIGLLGGRSDPYARVIEAELALECEDALKAGLRKAQRGARRGLKIKPNARRGSPRGRRKNSSMVHGSKELGGRMMEWQAPSEPQVGGVGSHFYAGMPVPMASAEQALRELKKDATQHRSSTPAADRQHLRKVISDLSKVIAKAKKTNPKFRVDFDSPQFGRGGMDIDVTPTESGHHVDIDIDQHKHRFGFDVSAHQLPEHAGEPEATEAVMGDVPESAVVEGASHRRMPEDMYDKAALAEEFAEYPEGAEPATVSNRGRRTKRLGRRSNCGGMKMNPARFRLFDDGGKTADRYTLIDSKPQGDTKYRTYFGFSERPWSPQGIGQHGEFSASEWSQQGNFRHLGKRIGLEDLDPDLQKYISKMIKEWGGDPKSAMRGRHSLKAKAKGKKATRKPKTVANRRRARKPARRARKPARRTNRPRKSMAEFIRENRDEIDAGIRRALGRPDSRLNNEERRQWILNDEGLYNWARSEGVRV